MFAESMWTMAAAGGSVSPAVVMILGFGTVFVGLLFLIGIITLMGKINEAADADPDTPFSDKMKRAWGAFKGELPAAAALPAPAKEEAPALEAAAAEAAPASEEVTDEEIAAISACVATVMGADVSAIRIASITRKN